MAKTNIQIKENKIIEYLTEASDTWISYNKNPLATINRCIKSMKHNNKEAMEILYNYKPVSKPPHPFNKKRENIL